MARYYRQFIQLHYQASITSVFKHFSGCLPNCSLLSFAHEYIRFSHPMEAAARRKTTQGHRVLPVGWYILRPLSSAFPPIADCLLQTAGSLTRYPAIPPSHLTYPATLLFCPPYSLQPSLHPATPLPICRPLCHNQPVKTKASGTTVTNAFFADILL